MSPSPVGRRPSIDSTTPRSAPRRLSILAGLLAAALAVNGLWLALAPESFYARTPGVADTGPFNAHFIVDVGFAYLAAGLAAALVAARADWWPALLPAALFLGLHALAHLVEWASHGVPGSDALTGELVGVMLPPVLVLWLARAARRGSSCAA